MSFGPYADGEPSGRLLGAPIGALERSRLFTACNARMRRMVERDRVYASEHTDFQVHLAADRSVVAVMATLLPPDQDLADDVFGYLARRDDGVDLPMALQWSLLLQLAHEVMGLSASDAVDLLNNIYRDGYLPRDVGEVQIGLVATKRFQSGDKALGLLTGLKGVD